MFDPSFFESLNEDHIEVQKLKTPEPSHAARLKECIDKLNQRRMKEPLREALKPIATGAYHSGIHTKDFPEMKFDDVFDSRGRAKPEIRTKKGMIPITKEVQQALEKYLSYRNSSSPLREDSYLFEDYKDEKKIARHLRKYGGFTPAELQRAGMREGFQNRKSAKELAEQYSRSERHMEGVRMNRIEPNGQHRKKTRIIFKALGEGKICEVEAIILSREKNYRHWLRTGEIPDTPENRESLKYK